MAINFPASPADGDEYDNDGTLYRYDATKSVWRAVASITNAVSLNIPDDINDLTDTDGLLGGITVYAAITDLPNTAPAGRLAFVSGEKKLYLNDGTVWNLIESTNTAPVITGAPDPTYALATDGTPTVITLLANDPEGLPITYTYNTTDIGTIATVSQNENVFTVTPSTNIADAGTFSITFTVNDGVNATDSVSSFTLKFLTYQLWNVGETAATLTTVSTSNLKNSTPNVRGFHFNTDGDKVYYTEYTNNSIYAHTVSTPFDSSTIDSNTRTSFTWTHTSTLSGYNINIAWHPEGEAVYVAEQNSDSLILHKYTASTAWDISSLSFDSSSATITLPNSGWAKAISYSNNGDYVFVGQQGTSITRYLTSSPFNVTLSNPVTVNNLDLLSDGNSFAARNVNYVSPNGYYMLASGSSSIQLYKLTSQYDLSTVEEVGSVFNHGISQTFSAYASANGQNLYVVNQSPVSFPVRRISMNP